MDSLTGRFGEVAQLVEHTTENRGVAGSIPALAIPLGLERAVGQFFSRPEPGQEKAPAGRPGLFPSDVGRSYLTVTVALPDFPARLAVIVALPFFRLSALSLTVA